MSVSPRSKRVIPILAGLFVAGAMTLQSIIVPSAAADPPAVELSLNGTIVEMVSDGAGTDGGARILAVRTADGSIIRLAENESTSALRAGQQADLVLTVPAEAASRADVSPSDYQGSTVWANTAPGSSLVRVVSDPVFTVPVAAFTITADVESVAAPTARAHTVDVVFMSRMGGQFITTANLNTYVSTLSAYWNKLSRGIVSRVSIGTVTSMASTAFCNSAVAYVANATIPVLQRGAEYYVGTRHLLVLTPATDLNSACQTTYAGQSLMGTTYFGTGGPLHVFVESPAKPEGDVVAHEFGHSLGFEHAGGQSCVSQTTWDGPYTASYSPCGWEPYGNHLNIMGDAYTAYPTSSLNADQKVRSGLITPGAGLRTTDIVASSSYTLVDAATADRAAFQALEVPDLGNRLYYIEYTAAAGGVTILREPRSNDPSTSPVLSSVDGNRKVASIILRANTTGYTTAPGATFPGYDGRQFFKTGESRTLESGHVTVTVVSTTTTQATVKITRQLDPVTLGAVTATGTPQVGATLTANVASTTPAGATLTYQWLRNGVAIAGATGKTYKLILADRLTNISVTVTANATFYSAGSKTSAQVGPVKDAVVDSATMTLPAIARRTLTATASTTPAGAQVTYQWLHAGATVSTAATYAPDPAFLCTPISVRISSGASTKTSASATVNFADVGTSNQFYNNICWLAQTKITTGYGDGSYGPGNSVSRGEMAAFLYRTANAYHPITFTAPKVSPFVDITPQSDFYKEITWLNSVGITTGYDAGGGKKQYGPGLPVTREQMAAFLYRMANNYKKITYTAPRVSSFVDVTPANQFYMNISWLASTGITQGMKAADGTLRFGPGQSVTREQMAAFLQRLVNAKVL